MALDTALGMYLAYYVLLPQLSPWIATGIMLLVGLLGVFLTYITHPLPFVTPAGSIDWNMLKFLEALLYYILLVNIGIPFIIFTKNFFFAQSRNVKTISLTIMVIHFIGAINVSILFSGFFRGVGDMRTHVFDIILGVIGMLFIAAFFLASLIGALTLKFRKWKKIQSHADTME